MITRDLLRLLLPITLGLFVSAQAMAEESWLCEAVGTDSSCMDNGDGYKTCYDQTATGMGMGESESTARVMAEVNCNDHMTSLVIAGNMGGGASTKMPCRSTTCSRGEGKADSGSKATQPSSPSTQAAGLPVECQQAVDLLCERCSEESAMCQQARTVREADAASCQGMLLQYDVATTMMQSSGQLANWCGGAEYKPSYAAECEQVAMLLCATRGTGSPICKQGLAAMNSTAAECAAAFQAYSERLPQLQASGQLQGWCLGQ
ncbi:MAG: hypothetical protein RBU37_01320 [Myxococcota bacterium]|jgi:hypothetical protein|nr:hypothetical protein [Myxococcota bacterium]